MTRFSHRLPYLRDPRSLRLVLTLLMLGLFVLGAGAPASTGGPGG